MAGGISRRYQGAGGSSKLLDPLGEEPVFSHSARALLSVPVIQGLLVVSNPLWQTEYEKALQTLRPRIPVNWVLGGETRRHSVWNALQSLPTDCNIVVIHDAARPFVQVEKIQACLQPLLAGTAQATSLGLPCTNSIKRVYEERPEWVAETLPRRNLWEVHTPQAFCKDILLQAHQVASPCLSIHDDAELVERLYPGQAVVQMIPDDPLNIKLTVPTDRLLAQALYGSH